MATLTLDLKGLKYSMPLVKISVAIKKASSGDILEITCDSPTFDADVHRWCQETGHALGNVSRSRGDLTVRITKK